MTPKKPQFGTLEEWDQWEVETRKNHPVWFFCHWSLPIFWCRVRHKLSRAKWWLLHRLHPRHRYHVVHTGLPPGYYDSDTLILHAVFQQFEDFYRHWDWAGNPTGYAIANSDWSEPGLEREQYYNRAYSFAATVEEIHRHWFTRINPWESDDLDEQERLDALDDAMLHKIIDIRTSLWN